MNSTSSRPFAVVTGASSGIGYELARCCAEHGYDLLVVADEPRIDDKAAELRALGAQVQSLQADLATLDGVDRVVAATGGRPVDALLANAGHGLGKAFLDQDFDAARHVLDTNVTGTIALLHKVGGAMRARGQGRILITGSIAGLMPGSYQAVYNGSKAFLDSFSYALREELRDGGVTVTCLMPGATDTEFFARADLLDTKLGTGPKADAAKVARAGFDAMQRGKAGVVAGLKNKVQAAMINVVPDTALARRHAKQSAPGSAEASQRGHTGKVVAAGALGGLALLGAAAWWALSSGAGARGMHRIARGLR
jgi:short-subunit dehydrogenase